MGRMTILLPGVKCSILPHRSKCLIAATVVLCYNLYIYVAQTVAASKLLCSLVVHVARSIEHAPLPYSKGYTSRKSEFFQKLSGSITKEMSH